MIIKQSDTQVDKDKTQQTDWNELWLDLRAFTGLIVVLIGCGIVSWGFINWNWRTMLLGYAIEGIALVIYTYKRP